MRDPKLTNGVQKLIRVLLYGTRTRRRSTKLKQKFKIEDRRDFLLQWSINLRDSLPLDITEAKKLTHSKRIRHLYS